MSSLPESQCLDHIFILESIPFLGPAQHLRENLRFSLHRGATAITAFFSYTNRRRRALGRRVNAFPETPKYGPGAFDSLGGLSQKMLGPFSARAVGSSS